MEAPPKVGIGCEWESGFEQDYIDGWAVWSSAVFNDGTGDRLFFGGNFSVVSGATVNGIARWDGHNWSALTTPLGTGVQDHYGYGGDVEALAVYDDGTGEALFVAGEFELAGGLPANNIARWDGSEWSALNGPYGEGIGPASVLSVDALAVYDDGTGEALYVGGYFSTAGGLPVTGIARWDGTEWSAVGAPLHYNGGQAHIVALAVYDDGTGEALYAGGSFSSAGDVPVDFVAKWNGESWSALSEPPSSEVNNGVEALAVYDDGSGPALYAGGFFHEVGGIDAHGIAKWDGSSWSPLGDGFDNGFQLGVYDMTVYDDGSGESLYVGGVFDGVGGMAGNGVARWDGSHWSLPRDSSGFDRFASVQTLTVFNEGQGPELFAAGWFDFVDGVPVYSIARWNGMEWSRLVWHDGNGVVGDVGDMAFFDDGTGRALYMGGDIRLAGNVVDRTLIRWEGDEWSAVGEPLEPGPFPDGRWINSIAVYDDGTGEALYVGGEFQTAGGILVNNVAKWDGVSWSALGWSLSPGVDNLVTAMATFDDGTGEALYVAGAFETAGGLEADTIAKWNGSFWSPLGEQARSGPFEVSAMTVFDDGAGEALYVAGGFWSLDSNGTTANGIAKWDGTSWSTLEGPEGVGVEFADPWNDSTPEIYTLAVYDDGTGDALYVGGWFDRAGGIPAENFARWDGTTWSAVAGPQVPGAPEYMEVVSLETDHRGLRDRLYVSGASRTNNGPYENKIRIWNGQTWWSLSGTGGGLLAIDEEEPGWSVYVGGRYYSGGTYVDVTYSAGGSLSVGLAHYECEYPIRDGLLDETNQPD